MVEVQKSYLPSIIPINCFPQEGLRYAIFSGPDGLADYRSHRLVDPRPIGTNPYSREATSDTDYLWRAPPATPGPCQTPVHLRPRSSYAGEIGWHHLVFRHHPEPTWTGHQILTSEFRRNLEDLYTHRYQSPWYPGEGERPDPEQGGAYFDLFPNTGHRTRTSHAFRSKNGSRSTHSVRSSPARGRTWRRAPAATPFTTYGDDAEVVSVEHSEEGDGGAGKQGGKPNSSWWFQEHQGSKQTPEQEGESSSSSGQHQPARTSGSTGSNNRRQHFQHN